jgi:hypothetical protein
VGFRVCADLWQSTLVIGSEASSNFCGGGGNWLLSMVVVALGEPGATACCALQNTAHAQAAAKAMRATNTKWLLLITALVEVGAGLCLLSVPGVLLTALLGAEHATNDARFVGRIGGAALLAIGVASWMARTDALTAAQLGLLAGILIYDVAAAMLLAFAGTVLEMKGVFLWPAVALHAILAIWCLSCLSPISDIVDRRTLKS